MFLRTMYIDKSFQNFSDKITDILDKHEPITKLSLKDMKVIISHGLPKEF